MKLAFSLTLRHMYTDYTTVRRDQSEAWVTRRRLLSKIGNTHHGAD